MAQIKSGLLWYMFVAWCSTPFVISGIDIKELPADQIKVYSNKHLPSQENVYIVGVYMAARNDLFPFVSRNLRQMQQVGSNENVKILAHCNTQKPNGRLVTKRLLIEKNQIVQFGPDMSLDSGNSRTLMDFYSWQLDNFTGRHISILWGHGEGDIEPRISYTLNPSELFFFNPSTRMIELNRKIGFLDYLEKHQNNQEVDKPKSICFDNSTGNYLSTRDIQTTFEKLCTEKLNGRKFEAILCDACLMSATGFVSALKTCAHYFAASSEVVLGTGYDYTKLLYPLSLKGTNTPSFMRHVVRSFQQTYGKITPDYAQSAIDLSKLPLVEETAARVAKLLIYALLHQKQDAVRHTISMCIDRGACTHFDEPSYKDYGHMLLNFSKNLHKFQLKSYSKTQEFRTQFQAALQDGIRALREAVVENAVGKGLKDATGLSIYFPSREIHASYFNCEFAQKTGWLDFLKTFLKTATTNPRKK